MAKSDSRGRTKTTRHIRLDHALLESPAYRSLSPLARSLLIEFTMLCKGPQNNGRFWLSIIDAAARGGVSCTKSTKAAIDELIEMGFIEMTEEAKPFLQDGQQSRARTWRLTFEAVAGKRGPSNEFLTREPDSDDPKNRRRRKRMEEGLKTLKRHRQKNSRGETPTLNQVSRGETPTRPEIPQNKQEESPTINEQKSNVYSFPASRGFPLPCRITGQGKSIDYASSDRSNEIRLALKSCIASTSITQRDIAHHPACVSSRLSEAKLSTFKNRPHSRLRADQAAALSIAITDIRKRKTS